MKRQDRTKAELIRELEALEDRVRELEAQEAGRKRAEDALKESERRLESIIQGSPIPAFVIGSDHRVLYWNRALEELSKIKAEDVVGTNQHWRAFYRSERPCMADLIVDEAFDTVREWYSGKGSKSVLIEEAYEATDFFPELGEAGKWLRFTAAAIRDSRGEMVGAIETLEDITERVRAEDELIRIRKFESLGTFAGGVARDFDNLLSAILRNIFLARLSATDEDKLLEEGLAIAEKAGLQAKELAHRLITFAKGGYPLRKVVSIAPLLRESVEEALSGSEIRCRFSIAGDLWMVNVDTKQLKHVIQSIIVNAREAMPGGGEIDLEACNIAIGVKEGLSLPKGNYVRISIRDRGPGIPRENLSRIFDPYFTTKTAEKGKGMGLGLAISSSIIKNHDGLITVESEVGVGTVFYIFLPASTGKSEF